MRLPDGTHLTCCSNIHPGETWDEVLEAVVTHYPIVARRVAEAARFGVVLRLSDRASRDLDSEGLLDEFRRLLEAHGLYVFTLNGFPYGAFHGTRVKANVYRPDWRARQLARLLPSDGSVAGRVSTVPGADKPDVRGADDVERMRHQLVRHVSTLVSIDAESRKRITLALAPEPCCFLETIDESVRFFLRATLRSRIGSTTGRAHRAGRRRRGGSAPASPRSVPRSLSDLG